MARSTPERTRVEVVEGSNGTAEIFEDFVSNQAMQYTVLFNGQTETFMSLGEAYIEAGLKAGRRT